MHGWIDKVLRADLNSRKHSVKELDSEFAVKYLGVADNEMPRITSAVTGVGFTVAKLIKTVKRIWNLEQLYNTVCKFARKDDFLPKRLYKETSTDTPVGQPANRDECANALAENIVCHGWDMEGGLIEKKLKEFEIETLSARSVA